MHLRKTGSSGPPARTLADVSLDSDAYAADFALGQRYQAFSAELLRLSLLGIAGYGFLLAELPPADAVKSAAFFGHLRGNVSLLGAGLGVLGAASGAALAHRFFSTDCLSHQIVILRLLQRKEAADLTPPEKAQMETRLDEERMAQLSDLRRCSILLKVSAVLLFLGAGLTVMAFLTALAMR